MKLHLIALLVMGAWLAPASYALPQACDRCGCDSPAPTHCCNGKGLMDRAVNMFARLQATKRKSGTDCDQSPSCGCQQSPSCGCEAKPLAPNCDLGPSCGCEVQTPSCGCEVQKPSCGCEVQTPSCGCEVQKPSSGYPRLMKAAPSCGCEANAVCSDCEPCSEAIGYSCEPLLSRLFKRKQPSCGCESYSACTCDMPQGGYCDEAPGCDSCSSKSDGLLSRLFKKKSSCEEECDSGCSACEVAPPSCGCEAAPSCNCDTAPSCGCETQPSCGCEAQPSCGCESPKANGILTKFLARTSKSACGCSEVPSCGCETVSPSCGCEAAPSCGCEARGSCSCTTGGSCTCGSQCNCHTTGTPRPLSVVPVVPHSHQPQPLQSHGVTPPPRSTAPMDMAPVPAPPPPASGGNDAEVDPFQDDSSDRVRRIPGTTIQYQKQQRSSYGEDYDPQARGKVRIHFSDVAQRPNVSRIDNSVRTASHSEPSDSHSVTSTADKLRRVRR